MNRDLRVSLEDMPQTTLVDPAMLCAAAFIFLQLYLYPAVHIFTNSLFQMFFGRPLPLWHHKLECLSSHLLRVEHFHCRIHCYV